MRKLFFVASITFFLLGCTHHAPSTSTSVTTSVAQQNPSKNKTKTNPTTCDLLSIYARDTMSDRQAGVPMRDIINKNEENFKRGQQEGLFRDIPSDKIGLVNDFKELLNNIAEDAYSRPMFFGKEVQKKIISDFENEWYMNCYRVGSEISLTL